MCFFSFGCVFYLGVYFTFRTNGFYLDILNPPHPSTIRVYQNTWVWMVVHSSDSELTSLFLLFFSTSSCWSYRLGNYRLLQVQSGAAVSSSWGKCWGQIVFLSLAQQRKTLLSIFSVREGWKRHRMEDEGTCFQLVGVFPGIPNQPTHSH